ncbi:MAG TPA: DUF4231 domain-containing protein [Candidatus Binataceae bacterium]|nr:DUF4231 domain-containing protein [Candidatus Binataceae bacterium]
MIEKAWDEYRGWTKRARVLQTSSRRWNTAAMITAILAATLGCAAGQTPAGSVLGRVLSFLAATAAAVTPILGRDILQVKREAGWIRARAAAEAIKSECFRYAAHLGDYSKSNRDEIFLARREALADTALQQGLTPLSDPAQGKDNRCPPSPMSRDWYVANRLRQQQDFYEQAARTHEAATTRLRLFGLFAAILAAALGAAGTVFAAPWFSPWIGVVTTLGALIVTYGLMERRQYLAATYGAMAYRLSRLEERFPNDLEDLVREAEDLVNGEHSAWIERMTKTMDASPSGAAAQPAKG